MGYQLRMVKKEEIDFDFNGNVNWDDIPVGSFFWYHYDYDFDVKIVNYKTNHDEWEDMDYAFIGNYLFKWGTA
jgi:hypothetical protein